MFGYFSFIKVAKKFSEKNEACEPEWSSKNNSTRKIYGIRIAGLVNAAN
jgi:hypothetical protein